MPIYKGSINTESAYKGSTSLDRIYKGSSLVFESGVTYEQSGTLPLMTTYPTKGKNLLNYQIYGNSIQDGTPTPSTPVEIVSVGDRTFNMLELYKRSEGTLTGSARTTPRTFDYNKYYVGLSSNNYYVPSRLSDIVVNNNGVTFTTTDITYGIGFPIPVTAGTTYYIIGETLIKSGSFYNIAVGFYNSDGESLTEVATSLLNLNFTAPANATTAVILIQNTENNVSYTNKNIQVSTTNTNIYEPYGYKIPVSVQGINLLSDTGRSTLVTGSGSYGGLNFEYHDEDKTFDMWGTNTTPSKLTFIMSTDNGFTENTQCRVSGCTGGSVSTYYFQTDNGFRDTGSGVNVSYVNDINKISLMVEPGAVIERVTLKPMLTLGFNVNPEFEPYIDPVISNIYLSAPLMKLGNYADYVDFENQKVYRKIKKGVIDNNSTFGKFNGVTDYSAFYMAQNDLIDYYPGIGINQPMLSPQFAYYPAGGGGTNAGWTGAYQISTSITSTYERIIFSLPNTITDVASAKAWLATNPVTYYYPAQNVVEESITVPALSTENKQLTVYRIGTTTSPSRMDIVYKGSR